MTTLALPFPSGRHTRRSGARQYVADFFSGLREGLALAARYDQLSSKSDSELARLGLRREDIPRAVLAGRGR
jgi:hypothetical protein